MRSVNDFLLISVSPLTDGYPGRCPCFAGLYALVPRALKSGVTSTSTSFEPGAAATTTTALPGFRDGAAFRACGNDGGRRRGCCCYCYSLVKELNRERLKFIT